MAVQFKVPSAPTIYKQRYENFKGCDFKSDQMSIDPARFPDAKNLMLDKNGFPEKRPGYREILANLGGKVHKLFYALVSGSTFLLIHAGASVAAYSVDSGGQIAQTALASLDKSVSVCVFYAAKDRVFCQGRTADGDGFCFVFSEKDGAFSFSDAATAAYTPTVTAARTPGFKNGTALEPVNLLGVNRTTSFLVSESDLVSEKIDLRPCYRYTTALRLYLNEKPEDLDLYEWKEIAVRYYHTGTDPGDSTVKSYWQELYGDNWKQKQIQWYNLYTGAQKNKAKALFKWMDEFENYSGAFTPVFTDENGKEEPLPIVVNYANNVNNYNYYETCCMISDVFDYPEEVYFGVYIEKAALNYDAEGNVSYRSFRPATGVGDNMKITYSISETLHKKNIKIITGASSCASYGIGGAGDRIFLPGIEEKQNLIYFTELDNPFYWPDLNYIAAGPSSVAVMTLFPVGGYLCAAKKADGQNVNMFLISGEMQNGEPVFTVTEGVAGTGIVSDSVCLVEDEPHFLSENGIFSLSSSDITARKTVVNRSYFLDPLLTQENKPENACLVYWNFLLIASFPETQHAYILNTRDKTYYAKAGSDHFIYEGWLWTDIPAVCFLKIGSDLFFGTGDGQLMKFNTDLEDQARYVDHPDKAIDAYFKTRAFDDGSFMTLKNMRKRGCGILLKPFVRSSCEIYVITDQSERHLKDLSADIFNWEYIDFTRFEFSANPSIRIKPFNTKVKKYATIQFLIRNREKGESFGVIGIEKSYTVGNFKKY